MDITHALDQIGATVRDLAPNFWTYKQALIKEGFSEEQAMQLVIALQTSLLRPQP